MPTLANSKIPPPKNWDEFEDITLSSLKIKWDSPNLTKHGRQGQPQAGVDIYGGDNLGRLVGVQCKKTDLELSVLTIKAEIVKAETFTPPITAFYIATSAPTDVTLQREIRLLSEERLTQGKFPIGIFFWDDLARELVKNRAEFKKHYPEFRLADESHSALGGARKLSLLDIAYLGLNLKDYMALIFGELGIFSGEDPYQFESLTRAIEGSALVVFDAETSSQIIRMTRELTGLAIKLATKTAETGSDWEKPNAIATTIEGVISSAQYSLTGKELAAFTVGRLLGHWMAIDIDDKSLSTKTQEDILNGIRALSIDGVVPPEVTRVFEEYRSPDANSFRSYHHQVYSAVRQMLIYQEIGSEMGKEKE
jgi:hypothetical protein